ncbi:MAG TPA: bifunctional phosphopantothenoylcysteine decarboxylase/phosphopantothenate--cysteine ligase CoaBC [Thermoanaerobaculia bacterium]|nr:bifunctional phosphopantothenoylcysteine decarboxylase/phosphopantothenate--cysteine ligase CoaBC [Thermoanaerobaculia bacterium]
MKIVLGVSGGIAAYKTPELVRRLREAGADVRVLLTPNGARFVSALALAAVSGHGVVSDQWGDPEKGGVDHVDLARWSDLLLVAPATANILAKLAVGIADDVVTTYALAHRGALAVAPAMNSTMLAHETVVQNLETLRLRGAVIIEPDSGLLACGDEGAGRLPDAPVIVERVKAVFARRDLDGTRILVTAGPTREAIDPVRYLSNRSSGKMGYAIAEAASRRGAYVTLISGPTSLPVPESVQFQRVTTAAEMQRAVLDHLDRHDVLIKAAAVADFTPVAVSAGKIKKREGEEPLTLELKKTPDILQSVAERKVRPFIVAFAAETEHLEKNARLKLERKNADLIVANDVSDSSIGFDVDQNRVTLFSKDGSAIAVDRASKRVIADRILDQVVASTRRS